jgi:hypothetical protein
MECIVGAFTSRGPISLRTCVVGLIGPLTAMMIDIVTHRRLRHVRAVGRDYSRSVSNNRGPDHAWARTVQLPIACGLLKVSSTRVMKSPQTGDIRASSISMRSVATLQASGS